MTYLLNLLISTCSNILNIYFLLLIFRITLGWFPNLNWWSKPIQVLVKLTNPSLRLFRGAMPAVFGIDLSPILLFAVIHALTEILKNIRFQ
jgi:YggT family protein